LGQNKIKKIVKGIDKMLLSMEEREGLAVVVGGGKGSASMEKPPCSRRATKSPMVM
jgi:hypothetical protein